MPEHGRGHREANVRDSRATAGCGVRILRPNERATEENNERKGKLRSRGSGEKGRGAEGGEDASVRGVSGNGVETDREEPWDGVSG